VAFVIVPSGVIPRDEKVPNVLGLMYEDAEKEIVRKGFKAERGESRSHAAAPAGTVLEQSPQPGERDLAGATITLVVSGGQQTGEVPNVVGMQRQDAEVAVEQAGYTVGEVTERQSNQPAGEVIETRPRAGSKVAMPNTIALVVSAGSNALDVPAVTGQPIDDARRTLEQAGLVVELENDPSEPPGGIPIVLSQSPTPGMKVPPGTRVVLRVAGGSR
jgi:serine/threonine-protein kinase